MIPHDQALENGLLGGLLLNQNEFGPIAEMFHEGLFYDSRNRFVCRAIIELRRENKPIDIISVTTWLKAQNLGVEPTYVSELTDKPIFTGFDYRCLLLAQFFIRRQIIFKCQELSSAAEQPTCDPFELLSEYESAHREIVNKISFGAPPTVQDCHQELIGHVDAIAKLGQGEIIGVNTGFKELNVLTAGWQKSDLIILAGRPGMGKTSLALNFARSAAFTRSVVFFSLEMSKMQLYARMASQTTAIPLSSFLRDGLDEHNRKYFDSNSFQLRNSQIYIDDRAGVGVSYIRNRARKLKQDRGIGMVIVDHLGFIGKSGRKNTNDQIGEITASLKALAKELEIPVMVLCQLNREIEKAGDKRPSLKDLRDSGNIEQDADLVMFVYRPEYYGQMDDGHGNSTIGMAEIIIGKHRNGPLDTVITGFDKRCTNFYDTKQ